MMWIYHQRSSSSPVLQYFCCFRVLLLHLQLEIHAHHAVRRVLPGRVPDFIRFRVAALRGGRLG